MKTPHTRYLILLGLANLGLVMAGLMFAMKPQLWPWHPARPLTQPTIVTVAGDQPWQDTGLALAANQTIDIEYLSGSVMDASATIADANGLDYSCDDTDCCEPLPHARRSALIAQVGTSTIFDRSERRRGDRHSRSGAGPDDYAIAPRSGIVAARIFYSEGARYGARREQTARIAAGDHREHICPAGTARSRAGGGAVR